VLALLITLFVALYILGPDLVSRWIVSLFAPLRVQTRSKSEEIFNALVRGLLPFLLAVWITRHVLGIRLNGNGRQLWDLFWDLNDEKTAGTSRDALFTSLSFSLKSTPRSARTDHHPRYTPMMSVLC
jgi:hypothetical protein